VGLKVEASHLEAAREALREALEAWLLSALRSGALPPGLEVEEDPRRARFFALAAEMWRVLSEAPPAPPRKEAKEEPPEAPPPQRPTPPQAGGASRGLQGLPERLPGSLQVGGLHLKPHLGELGHEAPRPQKVVAGLGHGLFQIAGDHAHALKHSKERRKAPENRGPGGAGDGTRTRTGDYPPADFKSAASTVPPPRRAFTMLLKGEVSAKPQGEVRPQKGLPGDAVGHPQGLPQGLRREARAVFQDLGAPRGKVCGVGEHL
jgi:hypothetical protein